MTNLYMVTDHNIPKDQKTHIVNLALTAEQLETLEQYNYDSLSIYGHSRYVVERVETNKALKA